MTERTETDMTDQHDETKPTWTAPVPAAPAAPAAPVTTPTTAVATPDPAPTNPATPATPALTVPVAPVVAAAPRKKSGAWVNLLLGVAAVIAIGGVAFAIGRSTAPASAATGRFGNGFNNGGPVVLTPGGSFQPGQGQVGRGFFGAGGGPTIDGTVESIDATSMTIKLASGDTVTVALDGSTTYHQSTPASASDVAVGANVAVRVDGGRFLTNGNGNNGNGNGNGNNGNGNGGTRDLTASDVTVTQ